MTLEPGTMLPGALRIERLLARHGTGEIWEAVREQDELKVAVKVALRDGLDGDPAHYERFRIEGRALATVDHPHVVRVYGHGETEDWAPYVVMERLSGERLSERLERGPIGHEEVERIVSQAAAGLTGVHTVDLVHRNISPEAIFLCRPPGGVKLIDLGLLKQTGKGRRAITRPGLLLGNAAYLSPEQVSAKKASHQVNLWALAVVTYQMLTGELPFPGPKRGPQLVQIVQGNYAVPSTVIDGLPSDVDDWFEQAFAREPGERFQSAHDMATALSAALSATLDW